MNEKVKRFLLAALGAAVMLVAIRLTLPFFGGFFDGLRDSKSGGTRSEPAR